MVWNLFLFKGDFSFRKSQKFQGTKSGLYGVESPGWFDVPPKISAQDVMLVCCFDEDANHQLPIPAAFWIIQIDYVEECSSLMQNLIQIHCSTSSFECDSHTVHMLTGQRLLSPLTSVVKSPLFTHMHSSPLSLAARLQWYCANCSHYISNGWTFSRQSQFNLHCI